MAEPSLSAEGPSLSLELPFPWEGWLAPEAACSLGIYEDGTSIDSWDGLHPLACPRSLRRVHPQAPTFPVTHAWDISTPCAGLNSLSTDAIVPWRTCSGVGRTFRTFRHSTCGTLQRHVCCVCTVCRRVGIYPPFPWPCASFPSCWGMLGACSSSRAVRCLPLGGEMGIGADTDFA